MKALMSFGRPVFDTYGRALSDAPGHRSPLALPRGHEMILDNFLVAVAPGVRPTGP